MRILCTNDCRSYCADDNVLISLLYDLGSVVENVEELYEKQLPEVKCSQNEDMAINFRKKLPPNLYIKFHGDKTNGSL